MQIFFRYLCLCVFQISIGFKVFRLRNILIIKGKCVYVCEFAYYFVNMYKCVNACVNELMRECVSKCVSVNEGVRYCVCVCEYVHMLVSERVSLYFCVDMFYLNLINIHCMVFHNSFNIWSCFIWYRYQIFWSADY